MSQQASPDLLSQADKLVFALQYTTESWTEIYSRLEFKHSDWLLQVTRLFSTNKNALIPAWSE